MTSTKPTVSVIIPAYNRAHYISNAIHSALCQTMTDIEVIVVDDGSTDDTAAVVQSINDPRLRFFQHDMNRGIPATRNTGLEHAQGEFIAWLDSDDISRPRRLEQQIRFLTANPSVAMVGCCAGKIAHAGRRKPGVRVPPLSSADIQAWLLFRPPFQQSSITGRATVLKNYPYNLDNPVCEDLDVFIRLAMDHRIENLPLVLIDRRIHPNQTVRLAQDSIRERKIQLLAPPLQRLGMSFSETDLERHTLLGQSKVRAVPNDFLEWADDWLMRIRHANDGRQVVSDDSLCFATSFFWILACLAAAPHLSGLKSTRAYATSHLSRGLLSRHSQTWLRRAVSIMLTEALARS